MELRRGITAPALFRGGRRGGGADGRGPSPPAHRPAVPPAPSRDLEYRLVTQEPLVAILPSDHRLASREVIDPRDLAGETFIGVSDRPHVLRKIIAEYLGQNGVEITAQHEIDNVAMGISL